MFGKILSQAPPAPYPLLKVGSLKRKLISWGVGASQTHSYIFMFLDIYNGLVRLGIKYDFRCKVFKYVKPCAEKYPHKLPPPDTLSRTRRKKRKIEYI